MFRSKKKDGGFGDVLKDLTEIQIKWDRDLKETYEFYRHAHPREIAQRELDAIRTFHQGVREARETYEKHVSAQFYNLHTKIILPKATLDENRPISPEHQIEIAEERETKAQRVLDGRQEEKKGKHRHDEIRH